MMIRHTLAAALAAMTLTLASCTAEPTRNANPAAAAEDPYLHAVKAVAVAHDGAVPGAASQAPLAELARAIGALPAPKTREQRYLVARILAYHSAALRSSGISDSETMAGLNEAYDLLAAAERTYLQSSMLWDRLRVKRRGALATDPSELKLRMTESEAAVTTEFADFD